jgi:hypothetical protein
MGGVYTDVKKTLTELQRQPLVQEARSAFQHAMRAPLIDTVQRLSDRPVEEFISTPHVGPHLEVELFILRPRRTAPAA